jgi:signal peptidase I
MEPAAEQPREKSAASKAPPLRRDAGSIFVAVLVAMIFRTVGAEPFNVPSSSMVPTLMVGDTLIAGKAAYGFSKYSAPMDFMVHALDGVEGRFLDNPPQRGDVIVFKLPRDPSINYVKRLVGMPGERIQMQGGRLLIDGKEIARRDTGAVVIERGGRKREVRRYVETLPGGHEHEILEQSDSAYLDDTAAFKVPEGHYFFIGDNRDDSLDSRVPTAQNGVGFVPAENLVGRVDRVMFSRDPETKWWDVGAFAKSFRSDRWFAAVK